MVLYGSRVFCLLCARRARRVRTAVISGASAIGFGALVMAIALSPGMGGGGAAPPTLVTAVQPAVLTARERIEVRLAKEPCDRTQILALADDLVKAGEYRPLINRAEAFWKKCGPLPRLRWSTYEAHRRLSELDAAIADASALIETNPQDKDYWWWRGIIHQEQGNLEKAAADFRQSITIEPAITGIPFNLALAYEKLGKPCEAIFPIEQFLRYHPDTPDRVNVQQRLHRLYANSECVALAGKGRAVIRFNPDDPMIRANVKVGRETGVFMIDTGASYTVLTTELAEKLGLELSSSILVHTASGITEARLSVVDVVELQGVRATRVPVAVVDSLPPGLDGLLGLSYLARFYVQMESLAGKLTIAARRR